MNARGVRELGGMSPLVGFRIFFWILITLAKISFFPHGHKPRRNIVVLVGKFLKKSECPEMRRTYAQ